MTFQHRSATSPAVSDITFGARRGETIAFVGPSGAGKTTLVKLLVGLYPPGSGRILYNGISSDEIDLDVLRERIGFVTQDTQLFSGTIRENLLFVNPRATVATVALHTRFAGAGGRLLTAVRVLPLGGGRLWPAIARAVCVVLVLACLPAIVRAPLVESSLEATGMPASVRVERALALAPADAEARWARARLRVASARRIWESGQTEDGRVLSTWAERRREALPLFDGAVLDLTAALRARPSDPFLHDALGWAHAGAAAIDEAPPAARQAAAVTALRRAIALQPDNPYLYRSLAALALGQREPLLPIALGAARSAIARDPSLLPDLAGRFTAARARRRAVGAGGAGHGGRSARAGRAARRGRPRQRGGGAVPPRGRAGLAGHRGAGAATPSRARWRGGAIPRAPSPSSTSRSGSTLPIRSFTWRAANVLAARRDPAALDAIRAALGSAEARAATPHVDPALFGRRQRAGAGIRGARARSG